MIRLSSAFLAMGVAMLGMASCSWIGLSSDPVFSPYDVNAEIVSGVDDVRVDPAEAPSPAEFSNVNAPVVISWGLGKSLRTRNVGEQAVAFANAGNALADNLTGILETTNRFSASRGSEAVEAIVNQLISEGSGWFEANKESNLFGENRFVAFAVLNTFRTTATPNGANRWLLTGIADIAVVIFDTERGEVSFQGYASGQANAFNVASVGRPKLDSPTALAVAGRAAEGALTKLVPLIRRRYRISGYVSEMRAERKFIRIVTPGVSRVVVGQRFKVFRRMVSQDVLSGRNVSYMQPVADLEVVITDEGGAWCRIGRETQREALALGMLVRSVDVGDSANPEPANTVPNTVPNTVLPGTTPNNGVIPSVPNNTGNNGSSNTNTAKPANNGNRGGGTVPPWAR